MIFTTVAGGIFFLEFTHTAPGHNLAYAAGAVVTIAGLAYLGGGAPNTQPSGSGGGARATVDPMTMCVGVDGSASSEPAVLLGALPSPSDSKAWCAEESESEGEREGAANREGGRTPACS